MQRRQFLGAAAATYAAAHAGCAPAAPGPPGRAPSTGEPMTAASFRRDRRRLPLGAFGRVAYTDRGAGEAVLFLHGFPLNAFQWRGAIDRLSARRRCVAPDFMGLGDTEVAPGQSVAPDAQAAMLCALLDALDLPRVDVIANDSGGAVAQLLAAGHPARVRSLLLTNCDVEPDCPPAALRPVIELARAGRYAETWLVPWRADAALARSPGGLGGLCYSVPGHPTDEAIACYLDPLVATPERRARTDRASAPSALPQGAPLPSAPAAAVSNAPTNPAASAAADQADRVACKTVRDCWVSSTPSRHPIARPARFKGRDFKVCVDGEAEPVCGSDGFCAIGRVAGC